ncbi:MAG TPA: TraR/DksA family transcriptional regulator [Gammaproteobacteria bacterium]|nr:RNA polymerase-binding transcription factor DksA [bacterium BMS3Abin11]GMT39908.1 MAG: conjugal transfer protein TraR [bacterium]HDH15425.1 TraR/DksA family transcriptional regulator [Gammaproteobacteria bacterium]
MPNINEKDLNQLRDRLLTYRKQLLQEIHDKLIRDGSSDAISMAGRVHDAQEESLSEMLTEINLAMLTQHQHELKNLERAIKRMDEGKYGRCIDCDAPIAIARLQAYPTAVRCINCQAKHERA